MKKITLLMALLCAASVFAQHRVPQHVAQLIKEHTVFKPVAPLSPAASQNDASVQKAVKNATLATLNPSLTKDIQLHKYPAIELSVPYNGSVVTLQLYRTEVLAEGFHVDTDKQKNIDFTAGAYYRGMVKGDPNSIASFSFFGREMNGMVSSAALHNLVVGRLNRPGNFTNYVVYSDIDLNAASTFSCGVTDGVVPQPVHPNTGKSVQAVQTERCVTVYFELDYDLFLANNSDTALTSNWITSVFNNVQTLYANDGITTAIKSVFIWTEQDPYSGTSSTDYLYGFYLARPVFDGDVGQLLGIDEGGLGGVAINVNGLCSDNNVSYSDVNFDYAQVPVFSWTVEVITHELGHLYGSPHTHGCYWNGDNTAIDGCGSSVGYVEGDCEQGPIPYDEQGTIMSYCHLVGGVGINFANGFGPQPTALIQQTVDAAQCLSTDCVSTCINTVATLSLTDADATTATLTWQDASGGPWQVGYAPYGQEVTNWQEVAETSITIEGLDANTYYDFAVRPECPAGQVSGAQELTFSTGTDWCAGNALFTDTGGTGANYPSNQHLVRIIKPDSAGQYLTVTFNSFSTETDYDFMYVYGGLGTNEETLLGIYSGNTIPGPFDTQNDDNALTFEFISDEYLTAQGWNASVACTTVAATAGNSFAGLSYYPNPVSGVVTLQAPQGITQVAIYNVAGQLIAEKKAAGTSDVIDMSAYANGIYFFKVSNGDSSTTLKVLKQ